MDLRIVSLKKSNKHDKRQHVNAAFFRPHFNPPVYNVSSSAVDILKVIVFFI